jgi:hypothetical protein
MNNKFFLYALFVTVITTGTSWVKMIGASTNSTNTRGGSSWSSHSGSGGGYYGGGGGGGHK